jgi:hypothetical protein
MRRILVERADLCQIDAVITPRHSDND